jgi:hypothetical protein
MFLIDLVKIHGITALEKQINLDGAVEGASQRSEGHTNVALWLT